MHRRNNPRSLADPHYIRGTQDAKLVLTQKNLYVSGWLVDPSEVSGSAQLNDVACQAFIVFVSIDELYGFSRVGLDDYFSIPELPSFLDPIVHSPQLCFQGIASANPTGESSEECRILVAKDPSTSGDVLLVNTPVGVNFDPSWFWGSPRLVPPNVSSYPSSRACISIKHRFCLFELALQPIDLVFDVLFFPVENHIVSPLSYPPSCHREPSALLLLSLASLVSCQTPQRSSGVKPCFFPFCVAHDPPMLDEPHERSYSVGHSEFPNLFPPFAIPLTLPFQGWSATSIRLQSHVPLGFHKSATRCSSAFLLRGPISHLRSGSSPTHRSVQNRVPLPFFTTLFTPHSKFGAVA
ncbi:uncharacterized protein LOC116014722 [Ipomoea triloba]|uniref:uncharacterized protein LOC116014722 n=1 Tax=Ipomoea triloba TaxID=35885 RepID=UPI00125D5308|nr:uncharacterized protein LOC116014722 [Ipomoea triloba]